MRRLWILTSIVVICCAGAALAQDEPFVTVLGPDAQGARLEVQTSRGRVCVRLAGGGGETSCREFDRVDLEGPLEMDVALPSEEGPTSVGGTVRASVARVEFVLADGQRVAADTVAAPQLGGRAARELRFFLLTVPENADPVTLRLLDASGGVLLESDDLHGPISAGGPRPLRGPVRVASGRSSGAQWSLYASIRNVLEP